MVVGHQDNCSTTCCIIIYVYYLLDYSQGVRIVTRTILVQYLGKKSGGEPQRKGGWKFTIQTDHVIEAGRPYVCSGARWGNRSWVMDIAVPINSTVEKTWKLRQGKSRNCGRHQWMCYPLWLKLWERCQIWKETVKARYRNAVNKIPFATLLESPKIFEKSVGYLRSG